MKIKLDLSDGLSTPEVFGLEEFEIILIVLKFKKLFSKKFLLKSFFAKKNFQRRNDILKIRFLCV